MTATATASDLGKAASDTATPNGTANGTAASATPAAPTTDWRTGLSPELKDHPAIKDFKTPDDAVKALVAAQDWKASLPDAIQQNESIKNAKSVADLAEMYLGAQAKIGAKGIIVPKKDAPPAEWDAYWNSLGRPETPDKYEVPKENMPEGVTLDETLTKRAFDDFHKLGISKNQGAELIRLQTTLIAEQQRAYKEQVEAQRKEAEAALRKEWGPAYDQNMRLAENGAKYAGGDDAYKVFDSLGDNVAARAMFARAFAKVGRELAEDPIVGGGHSQTFTATPTDAMMQANDVISNAKNPEYEAYHNPRHPNHAFVMAKVQKWFAIANPEPTPEPPKF